VTAWLAEAMSTGTQRVAAWAELLDAINVFPVADGDTGRNLVLSLRPLLGDPGAAGTLDQRLLRAACGNAGNIAVRFIAEVAAARSRDELPLAVARGRRQAYAALPRPVAGTMLDVLDALDLWLQTDGPGLAAPERLLDGLQQAVRRTPQRLPQLALARVVDSGALGMLLWLEGVIMTLCQRREELRPPTALFDGWLTPQPGSASTPAEGYCVEGLVRLATDASSAVRRSHELGESVVASAHDGLLRLHLHASEPEAVRAGIDALGTVLAFSSEPLRPAARGAANHPVRVVSDAAASLSRATAARAGLELLDSYVVLAGDPWPETGVDAQALFAAMRRGARVSTSQASLYERHQHYQRLLARRAATLYLCVGSAYTGIWEAARAWAGSHAALERLAVIDSGAAAGRLALAALTAARCAATGSDLERVRRAAVAAAANGRELLFLERLRFLAAGGRLSRTGARCGDLLGLRPVISPERDGARRVAMARTPRAGLKLALERLAAECPRQGTPLLLLEYSDNRDWVAGPVAEAVARQHPQAEILLEPLSLTTAVHTGPGTWGVAWLPRLEFDRPPAGAP
jgi:hypothetical protein